MKKDTLSIGDHVEMTENGAVSHRKHHEDHVNVAKNIPVPFAGSAAETVKQVVFTLPEAGWKGTIVEIKERWWGQAGHDYLVKWDRDSSQSWHLIEHLNFI